MGFPSNRLNRTCLDLGAEQEPDSIVLAVNRDLDPRSERRNNTRRNRSNRDLPELTVSYINLRRRTPPFPRSRLRCEPMRSAH